MEFRRVTNDMVSFVGEATIKLSFDITKFVLIF
jgi:hypothetical protein